LLNDGEIDYNPKLYTCSKLI